MDVKGIAFQPLLPGLLEAIADAHFVAIDLELSGIQSRAINKPAGLVEGGKQTLQQRYEETKEAAEKYQVLQIGLTCVKEDRDKGVYIARPYNFFLNPILEERLDIERIFSYQSGAVEFLLSHHFRMEAPFLEGVAYLSREEEALARLLALTRLNKSTVADIQIQSEDHQSLAFVQRVRKEIDEWKSRTTVRISLSLDYLNIAPVGHELSAFTSRGLNNYEKRLVHQFVRAEYPELVTISRPGFIQILAFDQKREDAVKATKMKIFEEKAMRQIGLRWLVEAMVGGDLGAIDPKVFARSPTGQPIFVDLALITRQFNDLQHRLKQNRTVLVGHNLFMDLVNFYKCFFGRLPDRVEDFQSIMNQLFPMIIDTKYLATHNNVNATHARSSLEELDEELNELPVPIIETHFEHPKYITAQPAHEAGFDSFLTAKVLIRLSAKLEAAGHYVDEYVTLPPSEDDAYQTAPEEGGVPLVAANLPSVPKPVSHQKVRVPKGQKASGSDSDSQGVSIVDKVSTSVNGSASVSKAKKPNQGSSKKSPKHTAFSHAGRFDLLGDLSSDEDAAVANVATVLEPTRPGPQHHHFRRVSPPEQKFTMMPAWDSDFWRVYGNKLRVNGTAEGICELG